MSRCVRSRPSESASREQRDAADSMDEEEERGMFEAWDLLDSWRGESDEVSTVVAARMVSG